jgi:hypothetical protein
LLSLEEFAAGVGEPGSGISFGVDVDCAAGERVKKPEMVESRPRDWVPEGDVIEVEMLGDLTVVWPRMDKDKYSSVGIGR